MENNMVAQTNMTPIEIALGMDSDGFVKSRALYDFLQLDKSNYSRWCRQYIVDNPFAEKNVDFSTFVINDERNPKPTTEYKLTASLAKKIAMQAGGERGEQARCYFVACEQSLARIAKERQQWEIERAKGVMIRHILTDTIKMKVADSPNKRFAYPNYTKLIYKAIFNKTLDDLRNEYGAKSKESIRDHMTADDLREVESLEMLVSSLIGVGMGYEEIKEFIAKYYASHRLTA